MLTDSQRRTLVPVPALLAMVAALLLLTAGPALSGDFAGTLPSHTHVYFGLSSAPHNHAFDPDGSTADGVVNVSQGDLVTVVLGVVGAPSAEGSVHSDAAPWLNLLAESSVPPEGRASPPGERPPVS